MTDPKKHAEPPAVLLPDEAMKAGRVEQRGLVTVVHPAPPKEVKTETTSVDAGTTQSGGTLGQRHHGAHRV